MKIYIVRHGQTLFNELKRIQGWCDSPLTPKGIEQAKHLRSYFEHVPLEAGYHSGSERASDTLEYIVAEKDIPLLKDKRLKEVYFGKLEGANLFEVYPDGVVDPRVAYRQGGELRTDAAKRFRQAVLEMGKMHAGAVILVSHGSVIRQFLEEESPQFHEMAIQKNHTAALVPNCSVTIVNVEDDPIQIVQLPKEME